LGADGQQASNDHTHEQLIINAGGGQVKGLLRLLYRDGSDVWVGCIAWALYLARNVLIFILRLAATTLTFNDWCVCCELTLHATACISTKSQGSTDSMQLIGGRRAA
jgi:hypothetical protein